MNDEPNVTETIEEVLDSCRVDTASTFIQAKKMLHTTDCAVVITSVITLEGLQILDMPLLHEPFHPDCRCKYEALSQDPKRQSLKLGVS